MADADITHLCPELLVLYQQWLMECIAAGLAVRVTVTWRNPEDQDKAKAAGLSNASAGQSPHNCMIDGQPASKAFDFACFMADGHYIADGSAPEYKKAGEIGKSLGLVWGGDFHSIFDPDHLELPHWRGLNP
jgi:peptidoglycan L-alanyl-D-glutamate endopeptidase CwlK